MKHFNITFKPDGKTISIHRSATILEAAGQAGIILNTVCGGKGTCRKCVVTIEPGGQRVLACQYQIRSDMTVTVPAASRYYEQKILELGIDIQGKIDATIYEKYPKSAGDKILGLAVDLGTTTVVAKLVDMTDGRCLAAKAALNPQTRFGDDVISRIAYADNDEKLAELQSSIVGCLNDLIVQLCSEAGTDSRQIYEACIVGNTTMNHIFLKWPISQLGQAPYKAHSLESRDSPVSQTGLTFNPAGNVYTVENIAGFVGSDTVAVGLVTDLLSAEEPTLTVDIGTNGEIILAVDDKLYAASCAAGPALEGAKISCGSRAVEGAIESVIINEDDIDIDVIGKQPAISICGSGLIDAVAVMLDLSIIDSTGRFVASGELEGKLSPAVSSRIFKKDGQSAFCLARSDEAEVFLTQQDIRQIQLAKGAIRAGIKLLQKKAGLENSDIKHIHLAGAFGNYIRKESALRIGLLPNVPAECIHFVGNAAGSGARLILVSRKYRNMATQLASKIKYVEIANEPDFTNVYADSMLLEPG